MRRKQNFQPIAWFNDLHVRKRLDLNPPYQRRSVWNQGFKDYFIDTILMEYPTPAIFLYEDISPEGVAVYHVVDGKQRLTTILEFIENRFPVYDRSTKADMRGKYFRDLDPETRKLFWSYQFSVEYLPSSEEAVINTIFDRINRNVARLTAQELRHAQFGGKFITAAENLSDWMEDNLPPKFPNISDRSRKQMKDVELVAQLLLALEEGVKSYSTAQLDQAFADRDEEWEEQELVIGRFHAAVRRLNDLLTSTPDGVALTRSRLRNQADCFSLIIAIDHLLSTRAMPPAPLAAERLLRFCALLDDEPARLQNPEADQYFEAVRSASNDAGPRQLRISIMTRVMEREEGLVP